MPMLAIKTRGSTVDSSVTLMASRASSTARPTNSGSSLSMMSRVSLMTTEKPARKHFSLQTCRTCSMASMVSSEAPGWSYWMIIMVASPEKNISRKLAGIMSVGIWMPTRLLIQMALDTPGTSRMAFSRSLV